MKARSTLLSLPKKQQALLRNPHVGIQTDLNNIYKKNKIIIGWPHNEIHIYGHLKRKNTVSVLGAMLGDEGKGRLVDNKIEKLLKKPGIKKVYVVRYQGGNNAGHTVEKKNIKLALHLIPSGVLHKKAIGIMDRGMVIHIEDLKTEIGYVEEIVGSLKNRLWLSEDAILLTDLERAEEVLNREKTGRAKGGTGRGIAPAYAHNLDRLGLHIYDLLPSSWNETLEAYYDRYKKEFAAFNTQIETVEVPDYFATLKKGTEQKRTVGSKKEFIDRLSKARSYLLSRKMTINTFSLHSQIFQDSSCGVIFEGAQAAGLDSALGTLPDMTASNTTSYGIIGGTAFWHPYYIEERIGTFKIPYTSSVGERRMPTHIDLPKDLKDLPKNASEDQAWGAFVRETAHEYGTTTGRPRDITHLDLAFLTYNAHMSGIEALAGTHLDVAQETDMIKVCTHYTDTNGNYIPYQPGLRHQKEIIPKYVELPGWNGNKCTKAKTLRDIPTNAQKFLAFIQARTGFPIVIVTTGAKREHLIEI